MQVDKTWTIAMVKIKVEREQGIPCYLQSYIFAGNNLQNAMTLSSYSASDQTSVHLVLRAETGAYNLPAGSQTMDVLQPPLLSNGKKCPNCPAIVIHYRYVNMCILPF
jgi:hypothetical protein